MFVIRFLDDYIASLNIVYLMDLVLVSDFVYVDYCFLGKKMVVQCC